MKSDNNFWTFISKRLKAEAALADWRLMLGDTLDFDKLQRQYLMPTGNMSGLITCPEQCNPSCGFRKICEWEEKYEAACREWPLKSYKIEKADALFFTVKPSGLLPEITKIFKIIPHIEEFGKEEDTWKLGVIPLSGGKSATVYLTFKVWDHEIMDLIFRLNCEERRPYILLVTARKIIHGTSEKVLNDMGSAFMPLNEVLDFNADTEFELIRECSLAQLVAPPTLEPEPEPENIFRKCGDAWEVRFDGGEKFILTNCSTGAAYLHFMLDKPNTATPIEDIMRSVSENPEEYSVDNVLSPDGSLDGYEIMALPGSKGSELSDKKALMQYRAEAESLLDEIKEAERQNDNITARNLKNDFDQIVRIINESASPMGQKRNFPDQTKRMMDSFRRAVNYSVDKMNTHDPAIALHFKETIWYSQAAPGYFSNNVLNWDL